jgi:hypothetical protein
MSGDEHLSLVEGAHLGATVGGTVQAFFGCSIPFSIRERLDDECDCKSRLSGLAVVEVVVEEAGTEEDGRGRREVLDHDKRASRASQRALRSSNFAGSKEAFSSSTEALSRSREVLGKDERPRGSSHFLFDDNERAAGMSSKERLRSFNLCRAVWELFNDDERAAGRSSKEVLKSFHFGTGVREVLREEERDLKYSNVGRGLREVVSGSREVLGENERVDEDDEDE